MSYRSGEVKIRREHLSKKAIIYVRQSTKSQDRRNTGSKARQYDLSELALEFGWGREDVVVVDQDQAKSASSLSGREAFKGVLTEVALGHVGAIFCLMVDRLSRSDFDWPRIFKICQVTDTLIIDEERISATFYIHSATIQAICNNDSSSPSLLRPKATRLGSSYRR